MTYISDLQHPHKFKLVKNGLLKNQNKTLGVMLNAISLRKKGG